MKGKLAEIDVVDFCTGLVDVLLHIVIQEHGYSWTMSFPTHAHIPRAKEREGGLGTILGPLSWKHLGAIFL